MQCIWSGCHQRNTIILKAQQRKEGDASLDSCDKASVAEALMRSNLLQLEILFKNLLLFTVYLKYYIKFTVIAISCT
jgi:hypothetical protein